MANDTAENGFEDEKLLEIVSIKRDDSVVLSETEISDLMESYKRHHPDNIQWFYGIVKDYGDHRTHELIMDQAWTMELEMHKESTVTEEDIQKWCK